MAACAVLVNAHTADLDLGVADARTFIGVASCGFDAEANRIANSTRLLRGRFVYTYAALRALASWRRAVFTVRLDGVEQTLSGYTVAVANSGSYAGGMDIAPGALLDDGLLDVVMIEHMPRLRFLLTLPKVFNGGHTELPGVRIERAREVRVNADRPLPVYADGDPVSMLPVTVTTLPGTVRTLVPLGGRAKLAGRAHT